MARRQFLASAGTVALWAFSGQSVLANSVIKLRDLYNKDLSFSDLALSIQGDRVAVKGYMAPPLKSESVFFVLTKRPMATCPFCNDGDDWPDDIVAVYGKRTVNVQPFNVGIVVSGTLKLGDYKDAETGFFSRIRLINATISRA